MAFNNNKPPVINKIYLIIFFFFVGVPFREKGLIICTDIAVLNITYRGRFHNCAPRIFRFTLDTLSDLRSKRWKIEK
jgi:hypothetical protein